MDIPLLAQALTIFLTPALPYLLKAGEEAGKEAAKKIGGDAWGKAKELWGKLQPAVEAKPAAAEAAQDAAADPEDADAEGALRLQLKKILGADENLAQAVKRLLDEAGPTSYRAEVHGDGAIAQGPGAVAAGSGGIAVGGDVQGSVVVTGERRRDEDG